MKRFLLATLLSLTCGLCAQVRMVDGRLVNVSESGEEEHTSRRMPASPLSGTGSNEWTMPSQWSVQTTAGQSAAENEAAVVPGESLSEKLARIADSKLRELEENERPKDFEQEEPEKVAVLENYPPQSRQASVPRQEIPRGVKDAELEDLENEYASLLKKIRKREESSDAPKPEVTVDIDAAEIEKPLPESASPVQTLPEERRQNREELTALLEAEIKSMEENVPEVTDVPLPNYYTHTGACFNVISSSNEARELGASVVKVIEDTFASYFGENIVFPNRVNLQMLVGDEAKFEGHFQVVTGSHITISVKCDSSLPLDQFCDLAADAYLSALSAAVAGTRKPVPFWLSAGLKAALAQNFAMGISYDMARFAAANPPDPFREVVAYEKGTKPLELMESSAYWNIAALRVLSGGPKNFTDIMRALVAGADAKKILEPLEKRFAGDFELQMRVTMLGEIYSRIGGVKGFEDSDSEALYFLSIQKQREGEAPEAIFDLEIMARRNEIGNEIKLRIMEIKLAIPWANPVYYNAFVALGKMFEAADAGDEGAFMQARNDFIGELQKSRAVSERIGRILKN